ncbi:hypothetical protein ACQ4LE_000972, partial [Meloidogyne hapla]
MENPQNNQINSPNILIGPQKDIDQMINSCTTLEDEEVEWIEVTDDEGCEEKQKDGEVQKQELTQQKSPDNLESTITSIPTSYTQPEITEKISERLPDELSSISAVESDEQSEELTIPTTKDLLTGAAHKVAFSAGEEEGKENETKNEKNEEKVEEKEEKTPKPQSVQLTFFPTEKGEEEGNEDKNIKENTFEIPTIYFPKDGTLNEEAEKKKAAENEAERLLTEIGLKENKEGINEINKEENKNLNKLEEIEIKIQPFSYSKDDDSSNKEEKFLLQGDQENIKEKEENEEKIKTEESKVEETKFYEVPPTKNEIPQNTTLDEELNKPANVNYLIPEENKEEKILTETIILPKNVRFFEGKEERIGENKSNDEMSSLDEYELKLRRRSKEALELVDKICGLQAQEIEKKSPITRPTQFEMNKSVSSPKEKLKEALTAGVHGLSGSRGTVGMETKISESIIQMGGGPILDVECVSVSQSLLPFPMDCLLLPGNNLLVVDSDAGLLLISIESKQVLKQIIPEQNVWRNPECVCLGSGGNNGEEQTVFVLLEYNINNDKENKEENSFNPPTSPIKGILKERQSNEKSAEQNPSNQLKTEWRRYICRFSISDFSMVDRIEAPKWLRERVIWSCKMCSFSKFIYLAANTPNQGFLFELNCENGKWIECKGTRINSQFADVNYFASVGPVTELLLVETNRCYVQLISIYNSTVVSSRILGICERPGALCVDNYGNILIFDRSSSSVGLYSRAFLEKIGDLAFVERANCQLSARDGLIAILCKTTKELRLHKYLDKLNLINKQLFGENYFCGDEGKKKKKNI